MITFAQKEDIDLLNKSIESLKIEIEVLKKEISSIKSYKYWPVKYQPYYPEYPNSPTWNPNTVYCQSVEGHNHDNKH